MEDGFIVYGDGLPPVIFLGGTNHFEISGETITTREAIDVIHSFGDGVHLIIQMVEGISIVFDAIRKRFIPRREFKQYLKSRR